jgi:hypothetical protein
VRCLEHPPELTPMPFQAFLTQQPYSVSWIWKQFQMDTYFENLVEWTQNGDAISVSDGSFKIGKGASLCRILNKYDEGNIFAGSYFVPGRAHH